MELLKNLKENYGKDYAITTIRTFLIKLSDKGFVIAQLRGMLDEWDGDSD